MITRTELKTVEDILIDEDLKPQLGLKVNEKIEATYKIRLGSGLLIMGVVIQIGGILLQITVS